MPRSIGPDLPRGGACPEFRVAPVGGGRAGRERAAKGDGATDRAGGGVRQRARPHREALARGPNIT